MTASIWPFSSQSSTTSRFPFAAATPSRDDSWPTRTTQSGAKTSRGAGRGDALAIVVDVVAVVVAGGAAVVEGVAVVVASMLEVTGATAVSVADSGIVPETSGSRDPCRVPIDALSVVAVHAATRSDPTTPTSAIRPGRPRDDPVGVVMIGTSWRSRERVAGHANSGGCAAAFSSLIGPLRRRSMIRNATERITTTSDTH